MAEAERSSGPSAGPRSSRSTPGAPGSGGLRCRGRSSPQAAPLCSPQAALHHRGVPGEVLPLHAHRRGRAHRRDRGQAAGGGLLGDQDTHGAGKGCSPCRDPSCRRRAVLRLSSRVSGAGCAGIAVSCPCLNGEQGGGDLSHAFPCALTP